METLRDRIKEVMAYHGLKSNAEMAKFCGVTRGLVGQWLVGETSFGQKPSLHIKDKTPFDTKWIATGQGAKFRKDRGLSDIAEIGSFILWDGQNPLDSYEFVDVPYYDELEFAAGAGRLADVSQTNLKIPFAKASLYSAGIPLNSAICARVSGDSMEPVLPSGSTVGVDTSDHKVVDGQIYVIQQDNLFRVKQLYRIPGGYQIISFNKEYKDENSTLEDANIIGRVFSWTVMNLKK